KTAADTSSKTGISRSRPRTTYADMPVLLLNPGEIEVVELAVVRLEALELLRGSHDDEAMPDRHQRLLGLHDLMHALVHRLALRLVVDRARVLEELIELSVRPAMLILVLDVGLGEHPVRVPARQIARHAQVEIGLVVDLLGEHVELARQQLDLNADLAPAILE